MVTNNFLILFQLFYSMKPKPGRLPAEERRNRRLQYQHLRKEGLKPFAEVKLKPWEKRLLARSLRIVLQTSIGDKRKSTETVETVKKIIPIAAQELKPMAKELIPEGQYEIFCQLMDWYTENPKEFPAKGVFPPGFCPQKILDLGQRLSQKSFLRISGTILARTFFRAKNEERPSHRDKQFDFKKDLEFQLKHDIAHSLWFIRGFLESVSWPQKT